MDIISFMLGYRKGKAGAGEGGNADDVRYVTFMSGDLALYVKPVATGDDCVDVYTKGLIGTPTKEPTVDTVYTYSGWSLTNGGAASASALKEVTENRTVYAAFTSKVRTYTITYYDSDGVTVLKTETLAYGATPNYTPSKDGYSFNGWTPALTTVTGDASYTADFSEKITFAGGSWADIARICEAGEAADYFKVGDTRVIPISDYTITVAIAGFNHDDLADGSGKASISVVCMSVPKNTVQWSTNAYSSGKHYPYVYTGSGTFTTSSKVRTYLNGSMFSLLPTELQSIIKPVLKKSDATNETGTSVKLNNTSEKLWALSLDELGHTGTGTNNYSVLGSRYELFTAQDIMVQTSPVLEYVTAGDGGERVSSYWTRHVRRYGAYAPVFITESAYGTKKDYAYYELESAAAINNTYRYLRFGFCI